MFDFNTIEGFFDHSVQLRPYHSLRITKHNRWLIGPYLELKAFATALRYDRVAIDYLRAQQVIFGRREKDIPPTGISLIRSFRSKINFSKPEEDQGSLKDRYLTQRDYDRFSMANRDQPLFRARLTDQYTLAKDYYQVITLESHHIVEKSILHQLGVDQGALSPEKAPCVLVAGELHRRFFTPEFSDFRNRLDKRLDEAREKLHQKYHELYQDIRMKDLESIAHTIIEFM